MPRTQPLARNRRSPDRGVFLAVAAAALTAQVGAAMIGIGYGYGHIGPPAPAAAAATTVAQSVSVAPVGADAPSDPAASSVALGGPLGYSVPVRLTMPRIGIDTGLMTLGLNPDGSVEVPPDDPDAPAGWYRNLASPGQNGPAVFLGHVDAHGGPAVFYPLGGAKPGDKVDVRRADGHTATFTVERVVSYPREEFPTAEVYGGTAVPGLRLVTCGGEYDRDLGGYQENVVVYASLTATS